MACWSLQVAKYGYQKQSWTCSPREKHSGLVKHNSREELRLHHSPHFLQSPFLSKEVSEMIHNLSRGLWLAAVIQHKVHLSSVNSCLLHPSLHLKLN